MRFLLVHSPFLGPAVWGPLQAALAERGCAALCPDIRPGLKDPHTPYCEMARRAVDGARGDELVVLHSGAGALAPSIWQADGRLVRMVFLDALLPHPGSSWLDTLPPRQAESLRQKAREGTLPPWPDWLPAGSLERLVPDPQVRARIVAEAPAAPLVYVSQSAPDVPGWPGPVGCGYVRLSSAYDSEAARASAMGFWVRRFDGHHLSLASDPRAVGGALIEAAELW
jgi:hypothetical protein